MKAKKKSQAPVRKSRRRPSESKGKARALAVDQVVTPAPQGLVLEPEIDAALRALAAERGMDLSTLVRLFLRNMAVKSNYYGLDTALRFGKYNGETVETIIRFDPSYIEWCLKNIEGMHLSEEALDLLVSIFAGRRP